MTRFQVAGFGSFGNRITAANATRALNLADTAAVMRILRVDASNAPAVELISRKSADGSNVAYWDMYAEPSDKSFRIRDRQTGFNLDRLTIDHANGFVGIGTTAPAYKLHVEDNVSDAAVYARSTGKYGISASGASYGVYGTSGSIGLYGDGTNYGVYGTGDYGVYGFGGTYGVYGYCSTFNQASIYGDAASAIAVRGNSTNNWGGYFSSDNFNGLLARTYNASYYAAIFQGSTYCYGTYVTSDERVKKNIGDFKTGMDLINRLNPKAYEFINDGKFANLNLPRGTHYGFLAQDVEKLFPGLVKEAPLEVQAPEKIAAADRNSKLPDMAGIKRTPLKIETMPVKAINYTELIPVVVKGMQELDAENKDLKKQVNGLKEQLAGQQMQIAELRQLVLDLKSGRSSTASVSDSYLEQASPNPSRGNTIIRYGVPDGSTSARLALTNASGQVLKEFSLSNRRAGQVTLNTAALAAGVYTYTLWVNGQQADSKQLVIAR